MRVLAFISCACTLLSRGRLRTQSVGIKLKLCASPAPPSFGWAAAVSTWYGAQVAAIKPGHPRTHPLSTHAGRVGEFFLEMRAKSFSERPFFLRLDLGPRGRFDIEVAFLITARALIQRTCMHLPKGHNSLLRNKTLWPERERDRECKVFCALISGVRKNASCLHRCELERERVLRFARFIHLWGKCTHPNLAAALHLPLYLLNGIHFSQMCLLGNFLLMTRTSLWNEG